MREMQCVDVRVKNHNERANEVRLDSQHLSFQYVDGGVNMMKLDDGRGGLSATMWGWDDWAKVNTQGGDNEQGIQSMYGWLLLDPSQMNGCYVDHPISFNTSYERWEDGCAKSEEGWCDDDKVSLYYSIYYRMQTRLDCGK